MAISSYDKGDVVRCSGAFTNSAGTATDPTAVLFDYWTPTATALTTLVYGVDGALVKDSTGNYHVDLSADIEGRYYWRMYSTGTGKGSSERQFDVRKGVF